MFYFGYMNIILKCFQILEAKIVKSKYVEGRHKVLCFLIVVMIVMN
jgi:hypothetical protein